MDTLWDNIEKLSAVCRAAGAHLPDEELKALQVGKVAEEAGEAMHALHGLKGLTTCGDSHTWSEVQNDLVGAVIAALLAMHYIDPTGARATFDDILHRRRRRGREASAAARWPPDVAVARSGRTRAGPRPAHKLRRAPAPSAVELSLLHQGGSLRSPRAPRLTAGRAAGASTVVGKKPAVAGAVGSTALGSHFGASLYDHGPNVVLYRQVH
ncbi:MazG-like family protein [Streptomyces bacillaris]|uniref:MazG-like family protein n=1 Tax=Streptomyces bacillaris TaxID=68179 RepID=UPI00380B923E